MVEQDSGTEIEKKGKKIKEETPINLFLKNTQLI